MSKSDEYVVQAGDSYESIAGKKYGDQRAFGDLLRANGGQPLNPGDVIHLTPRRQDGNYFVSNNNVQQANAAGANSTLAPMQQYGDYVQNYKSAIQAGYAGVRGSPYAGVPGAPATTGAAGAAGGANDPNRPSITPNYAVTQSGLAGANAWLAQHPSGAPGGVAAPVSSTPAPNTVIAGASVPKDQLQSTGKLQSLYPNDPLAKVFDSMTLQNNPVSNALNSLNDSMKTNTFDATIPATSTQSKPAAPAPPLVSPSQTPITSPTLQQKATLDAQNQQQAYQFTQSVMSNQNVPMSISKDVAALIFKDAELRGGTYGANVLAQLGAMYDISPIDGTLVPRGTRFPPGSQNDPNFNTSDDPSGMKYSNTLPYGYGGGGSGGGRRGGGGGGRGGHGRTLYHEKDYTLGLGQ